MSGESGVQASEQMPQQQTVPIEISATDLFEAYQANEVAADMKYKGKILNVQGVIESISKDFMDDPYIVLAVPQNQFMGIHASFSKAALEKLSTLQKGMKVTLTCRGSGMVFNEPTIDCQSN